MANDKRDRKVRLFGQLDPDRFQQEVAQEIGISLGRKGARRAPQAQNQASAPGASEFGPGVPGAGRPDSDGRS